MIIKPSKELRETDALYHHIKASVPANETEARTKQILLELARANRTKLRRELVKSDARRLSGVGRNRK